MNMTVNWDLFFFFSESINALIVSNREDNYFYFSQEKYPKNTFRNDKMLKLSAAGVWSTDAKKNVSTF